MKANAKTDVPMGGLRLMAFVTSTLAIVYFNWALDRITFYDPGWPRPFPYPDFWLVQLLQYYDGIYPLVSDNGIAIHGNIPRVQFIVFCAALVAFTSWLASGIGLAWRAVSATKPEKRFLVIILSLESLIVLSLIFRPGFWPSPSTIHLGTSAILATVLALTCAIWRGWTAARVERLPS